MNWKCERRRRRRNILAVIFGIVYFLRYLFFVLDFFNYLKCSPYFISEHLTSNFYHFNLQDLLLGPLNFVINYDKCVYEIIGLYEYVHSLTNVTRINSSNWVYIYKTGTAHGLINERRRRERKKGAILALKHHKCSTASQKVSRAAQKSNR